MIILGITGGIATGKSTVTQMFADLGAPTESADAIARELLVPGSAVTQTVADAFPSCVRQGVAGATIDRSALARLIFSDAAAREKLDGIMHPPIIAELGRRIDEYRRRPAPPVAAAVEIPLLFEAKLEGFVDKIVVVAAIERNQIERMAGRPGCDPQEAERRIAVQLPLSVKVAGADYVVETDTDLEQTRNQVASVWQFLEIESGSSQTS